MDLSIIIITLNNKKILEECLASIKRFTKSVSYEIIVVDNNSNDGTQAQIRSEHPDVTLIENKANLGFSRANNKGLKIARGRYSLLLNDDTYIKDDAFGKITAYMDGEKGVGICGPKLLNVDGSIQRQGSILSARKWLSKTPIEVGFVLGACLFIRTEILKKIGLLDENLFFYNDDLDLCKRARGASFKVVYYPLAEVVHYGGFSSKRSAGYKLSVEGFRGGLYFCRKHYGPVVYSVYRALLLLCALAAIPFSLFNKDKLNAYLEIVKIIIRQQIIFKTDGL